MIRIILGIYLFFSCSIVFSQRNKIHKDSVEITQILYDFFQVFSTHNPKYLHENITSTFEIYDVGLVWNSDSIQNFIQVYPKPFNRENQFKIIKLNINKSIAWISYWNTGIFHQPDGTNKQIKWLESAILIKKNKHWKLAQLHSTKVI